MYTEFQRQQQRQVTVHPSNINITKHYVEPKRFLFNDKSNKLNKGYHRNDSELSALSRKKMSKAISYIVYSAKPKSMQPSMYMRAVNYKLTFVTLTLSSPQVHSDLEIKSLLLNDFFTQAKCAWSVTKFVWRAEKQRNGTIHFHVLTDKYIPWNELRTVWNRIQNKLGYVDRYRESMKRYHDKGIRFRYDLQATWSLKNQIKAYNAGCASDWSNPNSTDIHSVAEIRNAIAYVSKYMSKDNKSKYNPVRHRFLAECKRDHIIMSDDMIDELSGYELISCEGRLWGCSENLSNLTGARDDLDSAYADELDMLIQAYSPRIYRDEYYQVICVQQELVDKTKFPLITGLFTNYISTIFNSP